MGRINLRDLETAAGSFRLRNTSRRSRSGRLRNESAVLPEQIEGDERRPARPPRRVANRSAPSLFRPSRFCRSKKVSFLPCSKAMISPSRMNSSSKLARLLGQLGEIDRSSAADRAKRFPRGPRPGEAARGCRRICLRRKTVGVAGAAAVSAAASTANRAQIASRRRLRTGEHAFDRTEQRKLGALQFAFRRRAARFLRCRREACSLPSLHRAARRTPSRSLLPRGLRAGRSADRRSES